MGELPSDPWQSVERRLAELRADVTRLLDAIRATESKVKRLNAPTQKRRDEECQGESAKG